jgi:hypothetical protein
VPDDEDESLGDAPVMIVSEFANNPGNSVTNTIEQMAAGVMDALTRTSVPDFVEHYPPESTEGASPDWGS